MIRNYLLVYLFGISTCFVVSTTARQAIIGGEKATYDEFRYQVSLQHNDQHFCGGASVHEKFIVTAARCVLRRDGHVKYSHISVLAGTIDLHTRSAPALTRQVDKIYTPAGFSAAASIYDEVDNIAMLELHEKLPLRLKHFSSLLLPPNKFHNYENDKAIISGFGWTWVDVVNDTEIVGGTHDSRLRWAETKVLASTEPLCSGLGVSRHASKKICARIEQREHQVRGVCQGDVGSPLVIDISGPTLIGVLTLIPEICSEKLVAGTYARITEYMSFIRNVKLNKMNKNIHEHVLTEQHPSSTAPPQGTST